VEEQVSPQQEQRVHHCPVEYLSEVER
jgi:hypothetical protein